MRGRLLSALLFALAVAGVAETQPRLARIAYHVKEEDDVYPLPPPAELRAATLGWTAATVDVLWTQLLFAYGSHWASKREFREVPMYADAILELDPTFSPLYRYIGTLLAYRPLLGTADDVRLARKYLERGTQQRPNDWRLWRDYGEFLAFVSPSFLTDPEERADWRKAGAEAIGHSVELGADADSALSAATLLTQAGRTRDAIRYLYRAYEFTGDPAMAEVHENIGNKLAALQAAAWRQDADEAETVVNGRWTRELPSLDRSRYLLMGPLVDAALCAGLANADSPDCARDWSSIVGNTVETDTDVSQPESPASSP